VRADRAEEFAETMKREYAVKAGIHEDCFISAAAGGALAMVDSVYDNDKRIQDREDK
jgi:hypothetical protein